MPDEKKAFAHLPNVVCAGCKVQMNWEVDRDRMQLSPRVIACQSHGCPERGKRYKVPTVELEPA